MLDERGRRFHQDQMREVGGSRTRHRLQAGEGARLTVAVHSSRRRIEREDHAPVGREGMLHQHRRRPVVGSAAAVDDESATGERGDADGGSPAAIGERAHQFGSGRATVEAEAAASNGQRQLRPRAEAGVGGNGARDVDIEGAVEPRRRRECVENGENAPRLRTGGRMCAGRRAAHHHLGRRLVDGQPDAAVAPPDLAVEIDEAEMQAGGRDDAKRAAFAHSAHRAPVRPASAGLHGGVTSLTFSVTHQLRIIGKEL